MKAAVLTEFNRPLRLVELPRPEPGSCEVVVKVEASGICHTDIHTARGEWAAHDAVLPRVLGHEAVGIVVRRGEGVTSLKDGDRVAVPWLHSACGYCRFCAGGWETLCERQQNTGLTVDGGYAEYVKADARYVGRVPYGIDPREAAPLTCAGLTTYKAIKLAGTRPSDVVAVFGVGGLGHLAIQYARIAGATVVAVDVTDEKLELAKDLGAEYVVNPRQQDPAAYIQKLGGADQAIAVAVAQQAFEQAFASLRRGGRLVLVALPPEDRIQLPIHATVLNGISVIGSVVGNRAELAEVFELHRRGRTRVIYQTRKLEEVNDAFAQVESLKIPARVVLTF
ncbi:MAG TPA: zinc-dependent alcohol dehydrogenase [Myxococcales bacterium]|nr:zinc-dependent alcohol dehydrogenase [Myxococcales bacterium]